MPEGTLKFYNPERGYGYIIPDAAGQRDVRIETADVAGLDPAWLAPGRRLRYEIGGAGRVRLTPADAPPPPPHGQAGAAAVGPRAAGGPGAPGGGGGGAGREPHFLNPYNFVRVLNRPQRPAGVLGRCPPPPHDRLLGLIGRIVVEIEATTPLFVADARDVRLELTDDGRPAHRSLRFFRYGDADALPELTLRGCLRAIYEAVTNSCLVVLDGSRLSYRPPPDATLVPARAERAGDGWRLRLLPGTNDVVIGGRPPRQHGAWIPRYGRPAAPPGAPGPPPPRAAPGDVAYGGRPAVAIPARLGHGDACWALLAPTTRPPRGRQPALPLWTVLALDADPAALPSPADGQLVRRGWLCLTGRNIAGKHDERFFFDGWALPVASPPAGQLADAACWAVLAPPPHGGGAWTVRALEADAARLPTPQPPDERVRRGWLALDGASGGGASVVFCPDMPVEAALPAAVAADYEALLVDYRARFADEMRRRAGRPPAADDPPEPSRFLTDPEGGRLRDGDLVYARLGQPAAPPPAGAPQWEATRIDPVAVARAWFAAARSDRLPPLVRPCDDIDALCPACRAFGWVRPAAVPPAGPGEDVAVAGRVHLTPGRLTRAVGVLPDRTLAVLGAPHPTTTRFYLRGADAEWTPTERANDERVSYDDARNTLRGRKIYRHHGASLDPQEYGRRRRTNQNRTVRGARRPGTVFTFDVDFANLAPAELGALLWAIELEPGLHHRLGMARPLGFGSATMRVTSVRVLDLRARYLKAAADGGWRDATRSPERDAWLEAFKGAMVAAYGVPFDDLAPVRDLRALLGEPPAGLPIHYPRPSAEVREGQEDQHRWFAANRSRYGLKMGLTVPEDEGKPGAGGLPRGALPINPFGG